MGAESRPFQPTQSELTRLSDVRGAVLTAVEAHSIVPMQSEASPENPYAGAVGGFHYQFEGEEDLLHLIVTKLDGSSIQVEEAHAVVGWVLEGVPRGMVWLKPGERSHHFYLAHDLLPAAWAAKPEV